MRGLFIWTSHQKWTDNSRDEAILVLLRAKKYKGNNYNICRYLRIDICQLLFILLDHIAIILQFSQIHCSKITQRNKSRQMSSTSNILTVHTYIQYTVLIFIHNKWHGRNKYIYFLEINYSLRLIKFIQIQIMKLNMATNKSIFLSTLTKGPLHNSTGGCLLFDDRWPVVELWSGP